jgi:hypothetical protein
MSRWRLSQSVLPSAARRSFTAHYVCVRVMASSDTHVSSAINQSIAASERVASCLTEPPRSLSLLAGWLASIRSPSAAAHSLAVGGADSQPAFFSADQLSAQSVVELLGFSRLHSIFFSRN